MLTLAFAAVVALADPAPAEATASSATTAPSTNALVRGLAQLEALDIEAARASLEEAAQGGPWSLEESEQLWKSLGVVRAYLGDESASLDAFKHLLAIAPGYSLPYTTSPKATFVFERARTEMSKRSSLSLIVDAPLAIDVDAPAIVEVHRASDPLEEVARISLLWRVSGASTPYAKLDEAAPPIGASVRFHLPQVAQGDVAPTSIDVAVIATNAKGWELWRDPDPNRPRTIAVEKNEPPAWYTQPPALITFASVGVVVVAASAAAVALLWPLPAESAVHYRVERGSP
jgi:hypothetical protein